MAIHHIPGEQYDYSRTDIVHVAMSVANKHAVLDQIAKTAPSHVQITTYNNANDLTEIFYDDIEKAMPDGLYVSEVIETNSYLYKRRILYILKYDIQVGE